MDTTTTLATGPDTYKTLEASDGPRHQSGNLYLGSLIDTDADGQPSGAANGDDTHGGDDEDGIAFSSGLIAGLDSTFSITASAAGKLDAWIDFNRNGQFEAGEKVFSSVDVVAGVNTLSFAVPASLSAGASYARFRLSTAGGLNPTGSAVDGEVEDYAVQLLAPGAKTAQLIPIRKPRQDVAPRNWFIFSRCHRGAAGTWEFPAASPRRVSWFDPRTIC